jgi:hypothetical protein
MTGRATPSSPPLTAWPRISLWGRFDVARFGELLLPRIHEAELGKRLPGSRVLPWSPLGSDHPVALDGGLTALPMGSWSPESAARLAAASDAVIVAGSDVLATDDEALGADYGLSAVEARRRHFSGFFLEGTTTTPRALSAVGAPLDFDEAGTARLRKGLRDARYLSARDDVSRQRLERAGVEKDVVVVPDPVVLASRVFEREVLARRLDYLRLMDWFPREGAPVVVQGSAALVAHTERLAAVLDGDAAVRETPVLLLETEPSEGSQFVDAMLPRLRRVFRLPAYASLVDILAVFSGARGFIGDSVHGHMAALGFGVPSLFVTSDRFPPALLTLEAAAPAATHPADAGAAVARLLEQPRTQGLPASVAARLDGHFDALAGFADRALAERFERDGKPGSRTGTALMRTLQDADLRLDATRKAWEARSEQMTVLRLEMTEELDTLQVQLDAAPDAREYASVRTRLDAALAGAASLGADLELARQDRVQLERHLAEARTDAARLGDRLAEAQADASRRIAERDARLAQSLGELEALRAEFLRFTNLRLFRYTAPFRRLYAALRRLLRRG